jgi:hypothetical protein
MQDSLAAVDLGLQDLRASFARGLDTVTRTIHETSDLSLGDPETVSAAVRKYMAIDLDVGILSNQQQNQLLATMVRRKCAKDGFMPAWICLVEAAPNMGLPLRLVKDVQIAAYVYENLKKGTRSRAPINVKMSLGPRATYDSIGRIGPKSVGGNAWKQSEEYQGFLKSPAWSCAGYSKGIPPCVAMGWIGVQRKSTPAQDGPEVVRMQLLGTVDFDFDHLDANKRGFQSGFDSAAQHTRAADTKLQVAALIGMLNSDLQNHIRPIQNHWATLNEGSFNLGPNDVSPEHWTSYLVADCAALVPFAYDEDFNQSRTGMANGMIHLQCQDFLFDIGCSNHVSTVAYADAAGVAKEGIHAAYAVAAYEATAKYFLDSLLECGDGVTPAFGYSACVVAGPWGPFGTRYREWERCIKYMRQLKKCGHPEAMSLLNLVSGDFMLKEYDLKKDVGSEWARAMVSNSSDLVSRPVVPYLIPALTSELLTTPGAKMPDLCERCAPLFDTMMTSDELEEVHAMDKLPESVRVGKFGRPASLAVAFRRVGLWACSDDCCDICASRIGFWEDEAAYSVLSALMCDEPLMGPSMWMLQNYFVGCVAFWPIAMPFLLSGFDLLADLSFDDGAMGERDVLDI